MSAQHAVDELNARFGIEHQIHFFTGHGDFILVDLSNQYASAQVSLYGAQVLHFQPRDTQPVLWLSQSSVFQPGKAIRGGIPLCWPWFGPHAEDPKKPAHGFARISHWSIASSAANDDGTVQLKLSLSHTADTLAFWPHEFKTVVTVNLDQQLTVSLTAHNPSAESMVCSGALHTYFNIADVSKASVTGLENCEYIDKLDNSAHKTQQGALAINEGMDRVYIATESACEIHDRGYHRTIHIDKSGSHSTVVWNPWLEIARGMKDFDDEGYRHMVCVETCNAEPDIVNIPAGESHRLETRISVTPVSVA